MHVECAGAVVIGYYFLYENTTPRKPQIRRKHIPSKE
jgi:hypothetical protein